MQMFLNETCAARISSFSIDACQNSCVFFSFQPHLCNLVNRTEYTSVLFAVQYSCTRCKVTSVCSPDLETQKKEPATQTDPCTFSQSEDQFEC